MKLNRLPYHLRLNKAADRFTFIEAIGRLASIERLDNYTYYGMGGPFLEDYRLLYEYFPQIKMVSIEQNEDIYKCQNIHRPCCENQLSLIPTDLKSFITSYSADDSLGIFWLDYTDLLRSNFEEFKALLERIAIHSMVKITLRADTRDYWVLNQRPREGKAEGFQKKFGDFMPDRTVEPPWQTSSFVSLLQSMVQLTSQQALKPEASSLIFQPVCSFYYSDGTPMVTITGIISNIDEKNDIIEAYSGWEFANTNWDPPRLIDIPILSTRERLLLQEYLPCTTMAGRTLTDKLGYFITDERASTEIALEQYASFHRYSPYFIRGTP